MTRGLASAQQLDLVMAYLNLHSSITMTSNGAEEVIGTRHKAINCGTVVNAGFSPHIERASSYVTRPVHIFTNLISIVYITVITFTGNYCSLGEESGNLAK